MQRSQDKNFIPILLFPGADGNATELSKFLTGFQKCLVFTLLIQHIRIYISCNKGIIAEIITKMEDKNNIYLIKHLLKLNEGKNFKEA